MRKEIKERKKERKKRKEKQRRRRQRRRTTPQGVKLYSATEFHSVADKKERKERTEGRRNGKKGRNKKTKKEIFIQYNISSAESYLSVVVDVAIIEDTN